MRTPGLLGGVDAVTLRGRVWRGELTCEDVAIGALEAIGDDEHRAWAVIDAELLLRRARALDRLGSGRREALPLFGVPVAVKDNFDTAELPTAYGSPIYAGHRPGANAGVVDLLLRAGAMITGKTKCAEFAWMFPPDTANPTCPGRTPGGSSNGSAAAVAAGSVPLATGTQTAGSVIRPGSYCGVLGYKPTFGAIPRDGVKQLAVSLDTVGVFARSIADVELAISVLADAVHLSVRAPTAATPRIGFARTTIWDRVEHGARDAIETAIDRLRRSGTDVVDVALPAAYEELIRAQTTIQSYEAAAALAAETESAAALLSAPLRDALAEGAAILPSAYAAAKATAERLCPELALVLRAFDGLLTPSTTGAPPHGLEFTGDPLFCRAWTLIGAPCVSLPLAWSADELPAGLQLVGAPGYDRALLAAAGGLVRR